MCGIIAFSGKSDACDKIIAGLKKLEYRGYDSAGIAIGREGKFEIKKSVGKVSELEKKLAQNKPLGNCGIGHTRWATHGAVDEKNCHPQCSCDGKVAIVHNGIIENHLELKKEMLSRGYVFSSKTDTEAIANLLSENFRLENDPLKAIAKTVKKLDGSYAVAAMFEGFSGKVFGFCDNCPLVIGRAAEEAYIASDEIALFGDVEISYLQKGEIAEISESGAYIYDKTLSVVEKRFVPVLQDGAIPKVGDFDSYMEKEIFEEPAALKNTLSAYKKSDFALSGFGITPEFLRDITCIYAIGCGSSYHVALAFKRIVEELAGIPVEAEVASEFRYKAPLFRKNSVCVVISQSGETADAIAAVRLMKENGVPTIGIVNVQASLIARSVDYLLPTVAGREIAVATTKAYSAQMLVCDVFAIELAFYKGRISKNKLSSLKNELELLPDKVEIILKTASKYRALAKELSDRKDFFFIGRGIDYALSLEGSLKLKEVTCLHAEGYPAGELKHGAIALINPFSVAFAVATSDRLFAKTLMNGEEIKTRGGKVFLVTQKEGFALSGGVDVIKIPPVSELFSPVLAVVPFQLFSCYLAKELHMDVDKPKNLAKSVTVE